MATKKCDINSEGDDDGIYFAPFERSFLRIITPFEEFIHRQTTSGFLLMVMTILALVLANGVLATLYEHVLHAPLTVTLGAWSIGMSLHHWVNDGLMAFFFFIVGLELKREILTGELADLRKALLPVVAAVGGMIVPALIYYYLNHDGPGARGWGIPMATDIAFAVGALALLANRVPRALVTFLVALAIVDDLGAVIVIALFYTAHLNFHALLAAAGLVALLFTFNLAGVRKIIPYFVVAVFLWYALFLSGVHPTLAGVLGAFTVPARPKYDPAYFSQRTRTLLGSFEESYGRDRQIMTNNDLRAIIHAMEKSALNVMTPLQRLENIWHLPVAYLVIPVFALFNAGITLDATHWGQMMSDPVMLGVVFGLVGGKFIGVAGVSWLAIKMKLADLPRDTSFLQICGVALLAGIGFTMSMFIAQLSFGTDTESLLAAKTGILLASLLSGLAGFTWLWLAGRSRVADPCDTP